MAFDLSNRQRSALAGTLIILAYSMLTYTLTNSMPLGVITDILSGLAVIGLPILMFPLFNSEKNRALNYAYMASRFVEGTLMIAGGLFLMSPRLAGLRSTIYESIHIYFFICGAVLFYTLLFRTKLVPNFLTVWGMLASIALLAVTLSKLFGIDLAILDALVLPIILNELFLAAWLWIRGFSLDLTAAG